jgi:hypothetical protein
LSGLRATGQIWIGPDDENDIIISHQTHPEEELMVTIETFFLRNYGQLL